MHPDYRIYLYINFYVLLLLLFDILVIGYVRQTKLNSSLVKFFDTLLLLLIY